MKKDWRGIIENVFEKSIFVFNSIKKQNYYNNFLLLSLNWQEAFFSFLRFNSFFYKFILMEITAYESEIIKNMSYFYKTNNEFKNTPIIVIYNFFSFFFTKRFFILFFLSSKCNISTISHYFLSANWLERETAEMYGINFRKKWDSRNLLLEYSFDENPLLKSFPLTGYEEIKYDFHSNWIIRKKVTLQI